jgi:hypothetical protein
MLHFRKFCPIVLETRDAWRRRLPRRGTPQRAPRDMMNPDLSLHSRNKGELVPAGTPLSTAAETRLPMQ